MTAARMLQGAIGRGADLPAIASGSTGAPLAQILAESPQVYVSGTTGSAVDESGNGRTVTVQGSGMTSVPMSQGTGLRLNGTAHIEIPHNAAFNTASAVADSYAESEPCFVGRFVLNQSLADWRCLFRKGADNVWPGLSVTFFTMGDGSVKMRARCRWKYVDLDSPPGLVSSGTEFTVAGALGRNGLRLWVNGRICNGGRPLGRFYYGLEHRDLGTLVRNTDPIVIGQNAAGVRFDVSVNHFAAFFRSTNATLVTHSDVQAMVLGSGAAHEHPIWGLRTLTASVANLQSQIDNCTGQGGGTVELTSGGTLNANLELRTGVLLRLTASLSIASGFQLRTSAPTLTSVTLAANATKGATTVTLSSVAAVQVGMILKLASNDTYELQFGNIAGRTVNNAAYKTGDMGVIESISGNTVTLDRPLYWSYTTGSMGNCYVWLPTRDCGIEGPETISLLQTNGNISTMIRPHVPQAALRMWIDAEIRATAVNAWNIIGCKPLGCVDLYLGPNAYIGTEGSEPKYGHDGNGPNQENGNHPYGFQPSACRDTVCLGARFRSKGWHSVDGTGDNVESDWGRASTQTAGTRLEVDKCSFESSHEPAALATHQDAHTRVFAATIVNGGGFTLPGLETDVNGIVARNDGVEGLGWVFAAFHGGMSESYVANVDLQCTRQTGLFTTRQWFLAGASTQPWQNNEFRNITRADAANPGAGPTGLFQGNSYSGVQSPVPTG